MASAWYVQQRSGKTGWIDVTWSLGVGVVAFIAAIWPLGQAWSHWRQIIVAVLVMSWCLRLVFHIAERNRAASDDPRYRNLIIQWGGDAPQRMFWFLQSQAAVGIVLALSIMLAAQNPNPEFRFKTGSDWQSSRVPSPENRSPTVSCERSRATPTETLFATLDLWRWSRHPNYFFEWLSWVAYPIIAIDFSGHNPYAWLSLAAPACMYWVLVHVSGIPPLEDHMLRSRGEAFRAYQKRTRAFFPLPLK